MPGNIFAFTTEFVHFFDQQFKDFSRPFKDTFSIFQGLQEGQNQANIMPHQMLKVESAPIFISDTWEASLDKIGNKFQGLSSTDCNLRNFKALNFYFEIQGLSRRVRTLLLYVGNYGTRYSPKKFRGFEKHMPGARFSKLPQTFLTQKAISKTVIHLF